LKSRAILFGGVLFIGLAVTLSNSKDAIIAEPALTSLKTKTFSTLKAVAKITAVQAPPQETLQFQEQSLYEAKLNDLLEELPTLTRASEPRADTEKQIHGIQADEFTEGHVLAKLRKLSLENQNFMSSTQNAYANCAERSDLATSVRAICFMRAMEISIKLNNPKVIVDLNVPVDVRQLALRLVN